MLSEAFLSNPLSYVRRVFPSLFSIVTPAAVLLGAVAGAAVVLLNQPVYVLLAVIGLAVFMVTIYSPQFGLFVLIFITYTRFSDVFTEFHNSPSIAKPFIALLVVSILLRWVIFKTPPVGWFAPSVVFALSLLPGIISLSYSPVPDRVYVRLVDAGKDIIIALVVVVLLQTVVVYRRAMWVLLLSGIFLSTLSVFQYLTGTYESNYGGFSLSLSHQIIGDFDNFRATGPIGDPNYYAQIILIIVPLALERFFHEKHPFLRLVALWGVAASTLTIIFTYSRGGLISMAIALLVLFWYYPPKRSYIPFIIFGIVALFMVLPPNYLDRLFTLSNFFGSTSPAGINELSLRGRLVENLAAWEMFKANPLFGVGLGSYAYLFPEYSKRLGISLVATERHAHNLFLETLAETGMIGFLVFAALLVWCVYILIKARAAFLTCGLKEYAGLSIAYLAGFVGYFSAATLLHNGFPRYFYLILGLALAVRMVSENLPSASSSENVRTM